jgi:histidinol phosphatase-like enzyme (inositol monophosphatase family)
VNELKSFLDFAIETARSGGQRTLPYFEAGVSVEIKSDESPVTKADREAESVIREAISRRFPDHEIYGEEFGSTSGKSPYRWIVDPLDGTRNFVRGIPYYAALLALEFEGEIVVGVAYEPARDEMVFASRGGGAFDGGGRRLRVSKIDTLSQAMLMHGSLRLIAQHGYARPFAALLEAVEYDNGFGDYYGHLLVARGSADVMLDPVVAPYDVAAIKLIVEEAGGCFTSLTGERTIYGGTALSTNAALHRAVLEIFRAPREEDEPEVGRLV